MNKILLIIGREYFTRVRKKSFIIMTLLGPILMAAMVVIPMWLQNISEDELKTIAVVDESYLFNDTIIDYSYLNSLKLAKDKTVDKSRLYKKVIPDTKNLEFEFVANKTVAQMREGFEESDYYAVLFIPENILTSNKIIINSNSEVTLGVKSHIRSAIEKELQRLYLINEKVSPDIIIKSKQSIGVSTTLWEGDKDKDSALEVRMALSFVATFLIYMFVFMYGAQVMRGVIEEKTNRIVEVIISSVRPFQLMMGKIVGVALVGLTQFVLWILLTVSILAFVKGEFIPDKPFNTNDVVAENVLGASGGGIQQGQQVEDVSEDEITKVFTSIQNINFFGMFFTFLFYFIGGYLLYASLFAAIGSAVDNEADTQQFMLPITIPLIIGLIIGTTVMNNPDGSVAFWASIIPFTSPIVMMARIPFGVDWWEIALSASLLVLTFIGTTWIAGKVYRTGILMYGKKITYREILKWLRYKN